MKQRLALARALLHQPDLSAQSVVGCLIFHPMGKTCYFAVIL
jgi:hypothetical protein